MNEIRAAKIYEFRKEIKLTQEALARTLGVTVKTVNRWERAQAMPSPLAMDKLKQLGFKE